MKTQITERRGREPMTKYQFKCVVCQERPVAHEHVICRVCNEREYYGRLKPEELERLMAELQYRQAQDN
jgi:hypothetical protein